jgi:chromosomal replication initiation ATPase DnaA
MEELENGAAAFARGRLAERRRLVLDDRRDIVETLVAAAFAVPVGELRATTRRAAPIAFARQSAMYLAHVVFGLGYADVGRLFGRDRTTAAHACRLVEERREDALLDAVLSALELSCRTIGRAAGERGRR